jgi:hypothetical protein
MKSINVTQMDFQPHKMLHCSEIKILGSEKSFVVDSIWIRPAAKEIPANALQGLQFIRG